MSDEALKALLSYQQADMDGIMVLTSRQAIHEIADERAEMQAAIRELRTVLNTILIASEFHAQDGVADYVMRYAHESNARLIKETLGENQ